MKACKGLVGGWQENNFFGRHEVIEILPLIDRGRGGGWVRGIYFFKIRSVPSPGRLSPVYEQERCDRFESPERSKVYAHPDRL